MRQYSFDTLRIVCLRNEDNTEDDDFFVDILADGVSTRNLSEEKRDEAARFVLGLFLSLNDQSMKAYGKAVNNDKA
jgi:hypothetical protein